MKLFLLLLFPTIVFAQHQIRGTVISSKDGEPVIGVSVFINNTTKGSVTNTRGEFLISGLTSGKHELIASSVGFQKYLQLINVPANSPINITLVDQTNELNEVKITAWDKNGWERWGNEFMIAFLGVSYNAEKTKVKNWKDLRFKYNKDSGILQVIALNPLQIENKGLGYDLEYHLEKFEIDFVNRTNLYLGYPLFKEVRKVSKAQSNRRIDAYNSSLTRFIRSLYHNTLEEDGYFVQNTAVEENKELKRIAGILKNYSVKIITPQDLTYEKLPVELKLVYTPDSLDYYKEVLGQTKELHRVLRDSLMADQIVFSNPNSKVLYFENYLLVLNQKKKEERRYLEYLGFDRYPAPQRGFLKIVPGKRIEIQPNGGYYPPLDLFTGEYWSWSTKIADMLPLDFELPSTE